jgi:hypothetical protein
MVHIINSEANEDGSCVIMMKYEKGRGRNNCLLSNHLIISLEGVRMLAESLTLKSMWYLYVNIRNTEFS